MSRHALRTRLVALCAAAMLPWAVSGPGVHDPDCPHHQVGASGTSHLGHASLHASDRAAPSAAGHDEGSAPPGSDGRSGSSDRDCRCLGPCVLGAHAGPLVSAGAPWHDLSAAPVRERREDLPGRRSLGPVAFRLPFATGPPPAA